MSVQSEVKEKNSEQENEIRREETRKEEKQDDTAQVSEERVETKELLEAGESIKEEKEAEQMTVEDLEASKHIMSEGQESIVEKAPTIVEILREADVEGREVLKQEQTCAEEGNIKQVKDIREEIVQMKFSEKACIEETKSGIQERTDIEERERVIEINVEQVKDVMPTEIVVKEQIKNVIPAKEHIKDETSEHTATKGQIKNVTLTDTIIKDTSYVQQTLYVKEVNVEQKAEAIYEEQGERGSKTGVREAAQKCSSQPHTLPSPQNETENDSDLEFFNFEDFEVVDALEDEEEEEEEKVGKNDGKSKPLSSTSRRQERRSNSPHRREISHHSSSRSSRSHHSHPSHSRDRLKRSREDAKDKSGNSSRSSRNSSRHREDRSRHGHSRNQRKRGEDKSSDECRQCQKSPRNAHERDKTQVRKRSTDDEGRSSKRTKSVNEKQSCRKDSSSSKQEKETATQSQSEKPVKTPSISSTRKKNSHEAEDLSFTPHYAKKQEKSDTLETCKGCNTPLVSDRSLGCEPETTCLDRNMENTGVTKNGCIEKEEKTKVEKSTEKLEVDTKDIKVNCEKLKLTGKESDVKKNFELSVNYLQVADEDLEVKNKELESVSTEYELIHKELNSDLELALVKTKNNEIEPNNSHLISNNELQASDKQFRSQVDESVLSNKKIESQVKELECTTPQLCEESVNIKKSEPEDPEPKVMDQTISNIELEPESSKTLEVIKQYKPNKKELPKIKKEETSHEETGIGTRTRSAIRSGQVAPSMRATRSQRKTTMVEFAGKVKTEANKETSDKTPQKFIKEKMDQEPGQVCEQEVCLQNNLLIETFKSTTVCEKYQHCTILKNKAGEKLGNGDSQENTLLKMTAELHKEKKENEDCKKNTLLAEEYKEDAERENRNFRKNKLFSAVQEEEDGCTAGERKLEHCKKKKVVDVTQEKTTEGQPQSILMENSQNISFEENQPRTSLLEHLQDTSQIRDKAGHFHRGHKFADIPRKEECNNIKHENSPKCVHQVSQEDVANTSQTEDKCEICQNTIKEESKPTKAKDDENRNCCRESNSSKEDTNLSQTLDIKDNKRPLEAVEECAMKKKKEPAVGLGSTEHKNKEEKGKYLCKKGEIKEDGDERKNNVADTEMEETKTLEDISKGSSSKEVKRYSKVVVVGDARMTLLATSDIKEQLQEVTQVIVVPNLTLSGILEVVQREVVKEECPRGILLLCLAGVLGTLVECQVPQECKTAGHSDMHEMVPTTKGNSLDPGFPKQLASLKRKLQDTLGRGSSVLFFPVLPIDMTNFNEIAAKHHFDATGHKLEHLSQSGSLHYQLLQQYKKAVEEVNGSSVTYVRLVRFEFGSRGSCRKFTDELLQDGFSPTLDLVERYIVPQLQHAINMSNSLRFQQVALVGDACLAQVVKMQQQKGVEPCSFILQEEPGLRSLTPDSPVVKWLSGMCNTLIFLSVTLKDLATVKGESDGEKTHCFLPHDPSKAFDNFLQEALRVDRMLCSLTHDCTIITTPVIPLIHQTFTKEMARKTFCDKCTRTANLVTVAIEQVSKMLNQKNGLPVWNLNLALQKNKDVHSSSHQSSSLNSKVVQKAASTWECFLNCSQACIRVIPKVTITSVLQDHKLMLALLPKARESSRIHHNKEETQSSHSRHRAQTQSSHSTDKEQTHSRSSRDKKQTHNRGNRNKRESHSSSGRNKEQTHNISSNRNKEQVHNNSSKDKKQTQNSNSRDKEKAKDSHNKYGEEQRRKSPDALALPALDDITSPASSPSRHSNGDLDSISTGNLNFTPSPYPSSINSPEDFVDFFSDESFKDRLINSQSLTCSPKPWKHSSACEATPLRSPRIRLWSADSRDKPQSPQRLQYTELDEPGHPLYQQKRYSLTRSRERDHSTHTYPSPDPQINRVRNRSFSPREELCGRRSRSVSLIRLPLSPKRKLMYRRSFSRSLSPQRYRSVSRDASFSRGRSTSRAKRSISRGRRSVSRCRRSISRDRKSISRSRRSFSRGKRSVSRMRSISRSRRLNSVKRSISRNRRSLSRGKRSISLGRRSISRGRRSTSRGRRSLSRGRSDSRGRRSISRSRRSIPVARSFSRSRRSISRNRRSFSRSQRSVSRSRRSISRNRRSISRSRRSISRSKRSVSRSRSISRDRRYIFQDKRSISIGRSVSRSRRSISRGKRSLSRGRRSRSRSRSRTSSLKQYSSVRLPVHMPSAQQGKTRKSMVKEALETLRSVHEKECEMYRSNPSIHPDIGAEYRLFCDKKTQSILALGGDPTQYNMAHDWHSFWKKRMEEIFIESWRIKRKQCLALLDANQKPPSPQPSYWTHRSLSPGSSFSSLSSTSTEDQKRSSKKRKRRVTKERERNKKRNENQDGRSPPSNYPRDRQVERNLVISDRHGERSPEYCARPELLSRKEDDYMETRITDMLRVARQKEWDEEHMEKLLSSPRKMTKGSKEGWEQKSSGKHCPDPLEITQGRKTDRESREWHQQSPPHKSLGHNESWQHSLDAIGDPFPMLDHFTETHTVAESGKAECKGQHRAKPRRGEPHGIVEDQSLHLFSKKYIAVSSVSPESTKREAPGMEDSHKVHKADQHSSKSITQIFRSFAANKLDTAESTKHSHEGEVSSTTASPSIKIDVVNVLEVLTHLGDKLGALYDPLKLVLVRTKELQSNGADPLTITNDQDTKLLLQMIQEKLQSILKDGKLSIIKKVIIEEAEQRLSVLLELQEQRTLTGNLNLTQLAHHCLNMDTTATVDFIRKVLQCQGHTHLPEKQLMKLYMAVKAEQLKVVGDHHNNREAATLPDSSHCQSHNPEAPLCLKMSGDSIGLLCSSTLPLSQAESHASTGNSDFPPWKGRQLCSDTAQTTCLQAEMSSYPQEIMIGSIHNSSSTPVTMKPSKAFPPGQSSTLQKWSPQCHTSEPYPKASTSTPSGPPDGTFREATYHLKASKYVYKKPICITLPKHQPQKSIIGAFNPLRDCDTDSEEYE